MCVQKLGSHICLSFIQNYNTGSMKKEVTENERNHISRGGRLSAAQSHSAGEPEDWHLGHASAGLPEKHKAPFILGCSVRKLNAHMEEIDRTADERFDFLIRQHAAREARDGGNSRRRIKWSGSGA